MESFGIQWTMWIIDEILDKLSIEWLENHYPKLNLMRIKSLRFKNNRQINFTILTSSNSKQNID